MMIKDKLQKLVDEQANDEELWRINSNATMHEALLQKALRQLHDTIEKRSNDEKSSSLPSHSLC